MNAAALNQKLQALTRYPALDRALVQQFGEILRGLDDWSLFRINPLRFARQHHLAQAATLDLFIHGAKVGLFDFNYQMVCPGCSGIEHSHAALDRVAPDLFHCTICNMDVPSNLDDQVQVTFTLNPALAALQLDPYVDSAAYRRYFFSAEVDLSPAMRAHLQNDGRGFTVMAPDEAGRITFQAGPGCDYRLLCLEVHAGLPLHITTRPSPLPQIVDIELLPSGFSLAGVDLPAGEVTLHVRNLTKGKCAADLYVTDHERLGQQMRAAPNVQLPCLTAKMLLNTQTFRDLFRIQNLAPDLHLNVRSLTILFTDMKDSTKMYGQAGDVLAYSLVQKHFDLLNKVVRRHCGSIVKTMGDAIMATFSTPQDGVLAALDMHQEIKPLQALFRQQGYETGLKIGINEGPALAVNADERLDFFGQNVNIAARVQSLADAGEIWLTEAVYADHGVEELLVGRGFQPYKQAALLKGIGQQTVVYRCAPG